MPHKLPDDQAVTLLRGLVDQIKPEVKEIPDVPNRIINLLKQTSMTLGCCAEVLAYYTFPAYGTSFDFLKAALISGGLKDSEIKKLISKLPDDKRHLFEPLLGVRSFDFFEISQMSSVPFQIFFRALSSSSDKTLPGDLHKLYQRISERERTPENQQKLGDLVAHVLLFKTVRFRENDDELKSLQHLLQNLPEWKLKK